MGLTRSYIMGLTRSYIMGLTDSSGKKIVEGRRKTTPLIIEVHFDP
jgi:hypothetical protein